METEIVDVTICQSGAESDELKEKLNRAGRIIQNGGLVAFPTETVYGLGGDALNPASSQKIYAAKNRPSDNPLIVHIADLEHLNRLVRELPPDAKKLADTFWPGPLTMILKKSALVPMETTGGLDTVAVRMPNHPLALAFIRAAGGYVAAPSANLSGKPSPASAKHVIQDLQGRIDLILDAGDVEMGLESTIVDLTGETPAILRPGYITQEMIAKVVGETDMDDSGKAPKAPKAPGMKYRHYAPKGELTLVEGEPEQVAAYINRQTAAHRQKGEKTGVIGTDAMIARYHADSVKNAGSREDPRQAAKMLYTFLREFDDEDVAFIYAEAFEGTGLGRAVMNRLLKAAGHKIIRVS